MSLSASMKLHIEKQDEINSVLAEWITRQIEEVLKKQERFTLALSGGNTPKKLYALLCQSPYRERIPWNRLHFFFGDERWVPFSDSRNNGRMVYDALLHRVPVPAAQIHFIQTSLSPEQSAGEYETILHNYFDHAQNSFELTLLGMGDDGHTSSLFPGNPIIFETKQWVVSFYAEQQKMHRITLTAPIVNRSSCIAFLVTGKEKSGALKNVLLGDYQPEKFPSQLIKPESGELHWFIDEAAASSI